MPSCRSTSTSHSCSPHKQWNLEKKETSPSAPGGWGFEGGGPKSLSRAHFQGIKVRVRDRSHLGPHGARGSRCWDKHEDVLSAWACVS